MYVCMMYMQACVNECRHACATVWIWRQRASSGISLGSLSCLRECLLLFSTVYVRLPGLKVSGNSACLPSCYRNIGITDVQLFVGFGDSNSGSHDNVTIILSAELFP